MKKKLILIITALTTTILFLFLPISFTPKYPIIKPINNTNIAYKQEPKLIIRPFDKERDSIHEIMTLHADESKINHLYHILTHDQSSQNELPFTFLAFYKNTLVGSCSLLKTCAIDTTLSPWACHLYVDKSHRGEKIARKLIKIILEKATELGYSCIYFYTDSPTTQAIYTHLGGTILRTCKFNGSEQTIMMGTLEHFRR